jgi:hypothetical protein
MVYVISWRRSSRVHELVLLYIRCSKACNQFTSRVPKWYLTVKLTGSNLYGFLIFTTRAIDLAYLIL